MFLLLWLRRSEGDISLFVRAAGGEREIGRRPGEVVGSTRKGGLVGTRYVYARVGSDGGGWREGFHSRCASVSTGGCEGHEMRGGPAANEDAMGHAC